jgi:hypothetical protein
MEDTHQGGGQDEDDPGAVPELGHGEHNMTMPVQMAPKPLLTILSIQRLSYLNSCLEEANRPLRP